MLRTKTTRRQTLLSALVLLLTAAGGWAGADWATSLRRAVSSAPSHQLVVCDAACAGRHSTGALRGADEERATGSRDYSREVAHIADGQPPASAKTAGDGGGGSAPLGNKEFTAALPTRAVFRTAHSQAALKQRLHALLTRAKPQQQLALYPKHGFW